MAAGRGGVRGGDKEGKASERGRKAGGEGGIRQRAIEREGRMKGGSGEEKKTGEGKI